MPDATIVADLTAAQLRIHGEAQVLLFDTRRARRNRRTIQGARLSVLPPGAVWDVAQRRLLHAAEPAPDAGLDSVQEVRLEDVHDARSVGAKGQGSSSRLPLRSRVSSPRFLPIAIRPPVTCRPWIPVAM